MAANSNNAVSASNGRKANLQFVFPPRGLRGSTIGWNAQQTVTANLRRGDGLSETKKLLLTIHGNVIQRVSHSVHLCKACSMCTDGGMCA